MAFDAFVQIAGIDGEITVEKVTEQLDGGSY